MYWNNYGKLDSLKNTNKSIAMKFRYDPMGNRIEKRLYHLDGSGSVIRQGATHYVRDAQGNPLAVYNLLGGDTLVVNEFNLYGSNRLGMLTTSDTLVCATCTTATAPAVYLSPAGNKRYELSNHLGNVMTVISDKPVPIDTTSDGLWDYFNASVVSATDYYPFGILQPGRKFNVGEYRFGFNGFEKDDEIKGAENHISFADYGYDPRLCRRFNPDPIFFSWQSSYATFDNNPILFIDPTGKGAEVSSQRDENGKVTLINVKARVLVHGKDSDKAVELIKKDIQDNFKYNPELMGSWGGSRTVPVNFDISVETVNDEQLSERQKEKEHDQSINIVEMKDYSGYNGEGRFELSLTHQQDRGNTFSHEFFHMLGFNSGESSDETHFSMLKDGDKVPLMYSGPGGRDILKQRVVTSKDVAGLRNKQGLHFKVSPKKNQATKIIEYPDPAGPHQYNNGEKYK